MRRGQKPDEIIVKFKEVALYNIMKYYYITFLDYLKDLGKRFRDILGTKIFFIKLQDNKNGDGLHYQLLDNSHSSNSLYKDGIINSRRRSVTIQGITFEGDIDPSLLID